MDVQVLGPLRVTIAGRSVVPTANKARKLMAMLVMNPGRVAQVGTIERELWDDAVPASAATGIQNNVLQIRKRLAQACREAGSAADPKRLLVTEPTGYRLALGVEHSDLAEHRGLVSEADEAEGRGDAERASDLLKRALSLWRDAPLADVPAGPVLTAHLLRMEEDRKVVLYRRLSLDLRLRRYSDVIGELRALTALDPYDEALHERLMTALYLSGRRGEALDVYAALRSAMAGELGLEPSPRLLRLQQTVLESSQAPSQEQLSRDLAAVA
ncbi:BTAD domain-containing putative transcriptional regulator [Streptomyces sp. NPDC048219]|uniref:AfsR/SARP family transcriptional regulator n=1 Tax=Streptomyces sp. NPDC048219 TaxID=3365517 RepID=UPI0037237D71